MKSDGRDAISANPSMHYLHKDVFTFITSMLNTDNEGYSEFPSNWVKQGDTVFYSNGFMGHRPCDFGQQSVKDLLLVDSAWLAEVV
jgi:hypothetical protein